MKNIRTYKEIYQEYCDWLYHKTGDSSLTYEAMVEKYDKQVAHSLLYKSVLKACHHKNKGFYYFCKFIIGDLLDLGYPKPFRYNTLLNKWYKTLQTEKKVAIMCSRGHGKTMGISQLYNLYDMFIHKHRRIILVSASQEQANRVLLDLKNIIDNNEWLIGKKNINRWASETIGFNGGYVLVKGIGSEILGEHVDRILLDDILSTDTAKKISDEQIEDYIDLTLDPMLLNRNGQMILVGCVNENTKVLTKDGYKCIKELKTNDDKLETLNKSIYGIGGFNNASDIFDNGIKKTKKIVFSKGFELECTPNHPILTINKTGDFNWVESSNLTKDSKCVIQYGQMVFGNNDILPPINMKRECYKKFSIEKISPDFAYLLGLYTAEGSHYKEDSIIITNSEVGNFLTNNDMNIVFKDKRNDNTHWSFCSRFLARTMVALGVSFTKCYDKEIPNSVWSWKEELVKEFIRGYADGDGCATGNIVKFTSTSKKLLQQLQLLLLNFGIVASLTEFNPINKYNSKFGHKHIRYDLIICRNYVETYKKIGFRIKRKQEKLDSIPTGNYKLIPGSKVLFKQLLSSVKRKTNIKNCHHIYSKNESDFTVGKIDSYLKEFIREGCDTTLLSKILKLRNFNYDYVNPVSIQDSESKTLDFIIPNTHSFVSNGIISHNTPKHASDIFVAIDTRIRMDKNCPWKLYRFPAILSYDNKTLQCPDRFTWDMIMNKRLSMGPLKFAREYQLEFFSRDTSLFPETMIKLAKDKGKDSCLINKRDVRGPEWVFVVGVDIARSGSVSADYSVAIVLAYNTITQIKQVVHVWRSKGLKISEQAEELARISKDFGHPYFLVEQNNMGRDMIDELVDKYNLFVEGFVTGGSGQKKDELIRFLITAFEHEQLVFPVGNEESREVIKIIEEELSRFCVTTTPAGNEKFEGLSSHDDTVMALSFANRATQTVGVPFAVKQSFSNGRGNSNSDPYKSFYNNSADSDLATRIKMGLIK